MLETQRKEDLSICYVSALCAYAEIDYEIVRHDDDSTDAMIKKRIMLSGNQKYDSALRMQLKCTSSKSQYTDNGDNITYKLKVKNFNDLCVPATVPVILGLLILPEDEDEWIHWTSEDLLIRGCMYWAEFSSEEVSTNSTTVNVRLEKKNVINIETLNEMLEKIAKEEWP